MSDDDMRERARQADERAERRQDERRQSAEQAKAEVAKAARDAVEAGIRKR